MRNPINETNDNSEELRKLLELKGSFEKVFKCKDGEVVLKELADKCIFDIGDYQIDHRKMIFNEGKRNVFSLILRNASIPMQEFLKEYQIEKNMEKISHNQEEDIWKM